MVEDITISRENWKRKYIVVIRKEKSRKIISYRRWSRKFDLKKALLKFKVDNTLRKSTRKVKLYNSKTNEVVDNRDKKQKVIFNKKINIPTSRLPKRALSVTYSAEVFSDGESATARGSTPKEAVFNALSRIGGNLQFSDSDFAKKKINEGDFEIIQISRVYYEKNSPL